MADASITAGVPPAAWASMQTSQDTVLSAFNSWLLACAIASACVARKARARRRRERTG